MLGLNAPASELSQGFAAAADQPWCKGFAVGRTIFQQPAEAWFAEKIDDDAAVDLIARNYRELIDLWRIGRATEANK